MCVFVLFIQYSFIETTGSHRASHQ